MKLKNKYFYLYGALITALLASLASIFFIEVLGNFAAPLCWIERMLIFGLLLTLSTGIILKDNKVVYYSIPFLLFGLPASIFQQLVQWDIIKLPVGLCSAGFICTVKFFNLFGFISQATLCLSAFILITFFLYKFRK